MALPQKVVDQLARSPMRTQGALGQLLMLTTTLLALSLAIYLGLAFGYRPYLESQIENLDERIASFTENIPPEDQSRLASFYSQVINLKNLLSNHVSLSPFFEWLERNTQINVYFSGLNFNEKTGQVSLTATARSLEDISEQLLVFEKLKEVKEIKIGSISQEAGKFWNFNLQFKVDLKTVTQAATETNN